MLEINTNAHSQAHITNSRTLQKSGPEKPLDQFSTVGVDQFCTVGDTCNIPHAMPGVIKAQSLTETSLGEMLVQAGSHLYAQAFLGNKARFYKVTTAMTTSLVVLSSHEAPTMSSLEMVDYINAERKQKAKQEGLTFPCKKYRNLQHKSFLAKVPKVLGETSAKFFADGIFTSGNGAQSIRKIYNFPKREACLMAMSYSYELQAQVFDHMTQLEGSKDINLLDFSGLRLC